ncbi:MAG: hypothetical protein ACR2RV_16525, partial [Verrucomicrobiales bacterium]
PDYYHVFRKPLPLGWAIEKTAHAEINETEGQGSYYDTHRLVHLQRGLELETPSWEWVDWDRDRLVWIEEGKLFAGRLLRDGPDLVEELQDFNPMSFKGIEAPYGPDTDTG